MNHTNSTRYYIIRYTSIQNLHGCSAEAFQCHVQTLSMLGAPGRIGCDGVHFPVHSFQHHLHGMFACYFFQSIQISQAQNISFTVF